MLRQLGAKFPTHEHPELLVGLAQADDAAVYVLNPEQAIVQTIDFFAPLVDDAYTFGQIAAANALNDLYAMGARVLFALNVAAFPEDLPAEVVAAVLAGGADKVREAGAAIAGGHTIIDEEPKYGLAATGLAHPDRVRRNSEARPGDVLFLTKPLGTGVLIGAIKELAAEAGDERAAIAQMVALNRGAAEATAGFAIHAMTDVTGFGLAGHAFEMAENSGMQVVLSMAALPAVAGLGRYVEAGFRTGGQDRNFEFFGERVSAERALSAVESALLYDPQTCGGLLIAVGAGEAEALEAALEAAGAGHWRVGEVEAGSGVRVVG